SGALENFDPLCGDTACQLRTMMVKKFFEKQKSGTQLTANEQKQLAFTLLLTKTKELIQGPERITEKLDVTALIELLSQNNPALKSLSSKYQTDLSIAIKQRVGADAFKIFLCEVAALEKAELINCKKPQPFFIKTFAETTNASNNIPTIPCTLSIQAVLSLAIAHKVPVAILAQAKDTHHVLVMPNGSPLTSQTPVFVFEGATGNADLLLNLGTTTTPEGLHLVTDQANIQILQDCLLANAIQHPQIGSGSKDQRTIEQIITQKVIAKLPKNPMHQLTVLGGQHDLENTFTAAKIAQLLEINQTLPRKAALTELDTAFVKKCETVLKKIEALRPQIASELERFSIEHIFTISGKKLFPPSEYTQQTKMVNA
ncbi:TPA: hypothetical protein DCW54_01735, partial [Candidatus Dependentiae bacterium]|nr:hypothetical protein [Candidatus Dependentiae bacterium]